MVFKYIFYTVVIVIIFVSVAKGVGAPIFHVNGDDVEAVVSVCRLAAEWRQTFKRDCIVDIVCYRRHGHNSLDDPSLTQPLVYELIKHHPTALQIYTQSLIQQGLLRDEQQVRSMVDLVAQEYEDEFERSKAFHADPLEWLASNWQGMLCIHVLFDVVTAVFLIHKLCAVLCCAVL